MTKIVVIGSNSFSGSNFVAHCLRQGHDVLGISRSEEPNAAFLPYKWLPRKASVGRFDFLQARIPEDVPHMIEIMARFSAEYVVNFASLGMVAESWQYPKDYYQTNLLGNVCLHEGLRGLEGLKKYVHISTPEVYGNTSGYIDEDAPLNPTTPYAVSRAACDMHLKTFLQQYDFPVVWTRAANVYGPGQQLYRIVPRTILASRLGERLPLHGGGYSERSFIHIEDVCRATLDIAFKAEPGEIYHLSTKNTVRIRDLVQHICDIVRIPFNDLVEEVEERPGKDAAYFLNAKKAHRDFNWKAEISLEEGIKQTIAWVDANFDSLKALPLSYDHKF